MKTGDIFTDFEWRRAADGYQWRPVGNRLLMVPRQTEGVLREVTYRPFAKASSGMFLEFAGLERTPDSVLAFANRYGPLGFPVTVQVVGKKIERLHPEMPLNLWPVDKAERGGHFGEFLEFEDERWHRASWCDQVISMAAALNVAEAGAGIVQMILEDALRETTRYYVSWSGRKPMFQLRSGPVSLVGAMWLQAALSLSTPKTFRQCPVCQRPIEISRSLGARSDAVFCSGACKSRDLRQRKARAREMSKSKNPREIAKRLRTDAATVRGWLKK